MKIVNLTPHTINFIDSCGHIMVQIEPSGNIARITTDTVVTGEINSIPVTETRFGKLENLPSPTENTCYIVSSIVAQRCVGRDDVFVPNEPVRDDHGRVIGCRSLGKI